MTKIDILKETLRAVEALKDDLTGTDAATAEAAAKRYLQLLNKFYEDHQDMLAAQQYEAAKGDFEYFLRLLQLAIAYWQDKEKPIGTLH